MSYCDQPFEVKVIKTTDDAALLEFVEFDDVQEWIPFSQIEDNGESLEEGDECSVYLTQWIAKQKGVY